MDNTSRFSIPGALTGHRTALLPKGRPPVATAVKQLNRHANLFANSNGGPALENPSECRVTTTDLDWRGFMDDHRELAIEAVRLLWRRASQIATGSS